MVNGVTSKNNTKKSSKSLIRRDQVESSTSTNQKNAAFSFAVILTNILIKIPIHTVCLNSSNHYHSFDTFFAFH
mgnify:CR=1 FL=1